MSWKTSRRINRRLRRAARRRDFYFKGVTNLLPTFTWKEKGYFTPIFRRVQDVQKRYFLCAFINYLCKYYFKQLFCLILTWFCKFIYKLVKSFIREVRVQFGVELHNYKYRRKITTTKILTNQNNDIIYTYNKIETFSFLSSETTQLTRSLSSMFETNR